MNFMPHKFSQTVPKLEFRSTLEISYTVCLEEMAILMHIQLYHYHLLCFNIFDFIALTFRFSR